MFENLTGRFNEIFRDLRGIGKITDANVDSAVKEVKFALLEADVNYKVVKSFIENVKNSSVGSKVLTSLVPDQQFIKVVNDELINLMKTPDDNLAESRIKPTIIMLIGLQGVGKTTVAAKLASFLKKNNKKTLLTACDIYRPAAIKQLKILSEKCGAFFYGDENIKDPVKIANDAVYYAKENNIDYVILDTAGRLEINDELMNELKNIKLEIKPHEVMYVADAMMGQTAVDVAEKFNEIVGLDSIFITKLDGDARGGVALSVKSVTGCPIKFIGVGEKLDDIEKFYPDRMASRILGMGDVVTLVEKAQQDFSEEQAKKLEKKIKKKGMDFDDFLEQIKQIKKMGSIKDILGMLPGASQLKNLPIDDKQFVRIEAIIKSMTKKERSNPEIINVSRRKRLAKGSGTAVGDVNRLLKQFDMMNKMLKKMGKFKPGKGFKGMPSLGGLGF